MRKKILEIFLHFSLFYNKYFEKSYTGRGLKFPLKLMCFERRRVLGCLFHIPQKLLQIAITYAHKFILDLRVKFIFETIISLIKKFRKIEHLS